MDAEEAILKDLASKGLIIPLYFYYKLSKSINVRS